MENHGCLMENLYKLPFSIAVYVELREGMGWQLDFPTDTWENMSFESVSNSLVLCQQFRAKDGNGHPITVCSVRHLACHWPVHR